MVELGWIGDLALGAAALAGVRSLRQGLHEASEALAGRLDDHEERITQLEVVEIEAGEPTMVGFQMAAKKGK